MIFSCSSVDLFRVRSWPIFWLPFGLQALDFSAVVVSPQDHRELATVVVCACVLVWRTENIDPSSGSWLCLRLNLERRYYDVRAKWEWKYTPEKGAKIKSSQIQLFVSRYFPTQLECAKCQKRLFWENISIGQHTYTQTCARHIHNSYAVNHFSERQAREEMADKKNQEVKPIKLDLLFDQEPGEKLAILSNLCLWW